MGDFNDNPVTLSTSKGCIFKRCRLVPAASSMLCPRHHALVETHGMEKAERLEFGYRCDVCVTDRMDDPPQKCRVCETEACSICRADAKCCKGSEAELVSDVLAAESEAEDWERTIRRAKEQLEALREKRKEAAHA